MATYSNAMLALGPMAKARVGFTCRLALLLTVLYSCVSRRAPPPQNQWEEILQAAGAHILGRLSLTSGGGYSHFTIQLNMQCTHVIAACHGRESRVNSNDV